MFKVDSSWCFSVYCSARRKSEVSNRHRNEFGDRSKYDEFVVRKETKRLHKINAGRDSKEINYLSMISSRCLVTNLKVKKLQFVRERPTHSSLDR